MGYAGIAFNVTHEKVSQKESCQMKLPFDIGFGGLDRTASTSMTDTSSPSTAPAEPHTRRPFQVHSTNPIVLR